MSHIVLQARGLQTFYGKSHILHGVDLEVREGEIVTLLGRNGAGKTTTLRSLVGLTRPREGSIQIFDRSTTQPAAVSNSGVGRRIRPGRATHLREPDNRGKPHGAIGAPRSMDRRPGL